MFLKHRLVLVFVAALLLLMAPLLGSTSLVQAQTCTTITGSTAPLYNAPNGTTTANLMIGMTYTLGQPQNGWYPVKSGMGIDIGWVSGTTISCGSSSVVVATIAPTSNQVGTVPIYVPTMLAITPMFSQPTLAPTIVYPTPVATQVMSCPDAYMPTSHPTNPLYVATFSAMISSGQCIGIVTITNGVDPIASFSDGDWFIGAGHIEPTGCWSGEVFKFRVINGAVDTYYGVSITGGTSHNPGPCSPSP